MSSDDECGDTVNLTGRHSLSDLSLDVEETAIIEAEFSDGSLHDYDPLLAYTAPKPKPNSSSSTHRRPELPFRLRTFNVNSAESRESKEKKLPYTSSLTKPSSNRNIQDTARSPKENIGEPTSATAIRHRKPSLEANQSSGFRNNPDLRTNLPNSELHSAALPTRSSSHSRVSPELSSATFQPSLRSASNRPPIKTNLRNLTNVLSSPRPVDGSPLGNSNQQRDPVAQSRNFADMASLFLTVGTFYKNLHSATVNSRQPEAAIPDPNDLIDLLRREFSMPPSSSGMAQPQPEVTTTRPIAVEEVMTRSTAHPPVPSVSTLDASFAQPALSTTSNQFDHAPSSVGSPSSARNAPDNHRTAPISENIPAGLPMRSVGGQPEVYRLLDPTHIAAELNSQPQSTNPPDAYTARRPVVEPIIDMVDSSRGLAAMPPNSSPAQPPASPLSNSTGGLPSIKPLAGFSPATAPTEPRETFPVLKPLAALPQPVRNTSTANSVLPPTSSGLPAQPPLGGLTSPILFEDHAPPEDIFSKPIPDKKPTKPEKKKAENLGMGMGMGMGALPGLEAALNPGGMSQPNPFDLGPTNPAAAADLARARTKLSQRPRWANGVVGNVLNGTLFSTTVTQLSVVIRYFDKSGKLGIPIIALIGVSIVLQIMTGCILVYLTVNHATYSRPKRIRTFTKMSALLAFILFLVNIAIDCFYVQLV